MDIPSLRGKTLYQSGVYSKLAIFNGWNESDRKSLMRELLDAGFVERYCARHDHLSCHIFENGRKAVTVTYDFAEQTGRITFEERKYNCLDSLKQCDTPSRGGVIFSQIGVGGHGVYKDCPMIGMFYLVKLADGRAIIIDGGALTEGGADDVYNALSSHGILVNDEGRIVIAAWILTHNHDDHMGAFVAFAEKYSHLASVDQVLYCFPNDRGLVCDGYALDVTENVIDRYFTTAKRVVPRGGVSYAYGNATVSFLVTGDTQYSDTRFMPDHNDTSLTFMLEAGGVRVLFLADGGEETAKRILGCYSAEELKCDIVQIPHHGLFTGAFKKNYTPEVLARMTRAEKDARWNERFEHKFLDQLYETASPALALLPMGDTNGNPGCGRSTVLGDWVERYGQIAYFMDISAPAKGYDGVNKVKKEGLVTYIASSEEEQMITSFALEGGKAVLLQNKTLKEYFNENMKGENTNG